MRQDRPAIHQRVGSDTLVSFFFSSRRRHTRYWRDWSSDVCSSDLAPPRRIVTAFLIGGVVGVLGASLLEYWLVRAGLIGAFEVGLIEEFVKGVLIVVVRSEERRVGKECRSWWSAYS